MANKTRSSEQPREAVPAYEQEQVGRKFLAWLNQYPNFPSGVKRFDYSFLESDKPCMALFGIQGTYVTKPYVGGDYMADYQFSLNYRSQPTTNGERLKMDEDLDAVGDWAVWEMKRNRPDIGTGKQAAKLKINARSLPIGREENGDEDHQILMTLTYYSERR